MLSDDRIRSFTETVVPFLHVTTRIPGRKYDGLLKQKGFGMYPTLCFLDTDGSVITTVHYTKRSIEGFMEVRDTALKMRSLMRRAPSDPRAAKELLLTRLEMHGIHFARARAAAMGMEFTTGERLRFQGALVETLSQMNLAEVRKAAGEIDWLPEPARRAAAILTDLEIRVAMRPLLRPYKPGVDPEPPYHIPYDLFKQGKLPSDTPSVNVGYWFALLRTAHAKRDLATFELGLQRIRPGIAEDAKLLNRLERQLEELRAKARR